MDGFIGPIVTSRARARVDSYRGFASVQFNAFFVSAFRASEERLTELSFRRLPKQNLIFRFLQTKARVQIWMYENSDVCIEGRIVGFDEYMNLVLDDAEEVLEKKGKRVAVGRILLKGDNITLMRNVSK